MKLFFITFSWHQFAKCCTWYYRNGARNVAPSSMLNIVICNWATCLCTTWVGSFRVCVLYLHDKLGYGMYWIELLIPVLLNSVYVLIMERNRKRPHNQKQVGWSILIRASGLKAYSLLIKVKCLGSFVNSSIPENITLLVTFISSF